MKQVPGGKILPLTEPEFINEANYLMGLLGKLNKAQLAKLMQTSPKLTDATIEKIVRWKMKPSPELTDPALLCYSGEVFNGIRASEFAVKDLAYAQKHLRILSAVYGLLRPLDRIQHYRLEMQARLKNSAGKDLYDFWSNDINSALQKAVKESGEEILVNLASIEYYRATLAEQTGMRVITPKFLEQTGSGYRMVTIYAKKARGMMTRFAIENRIKKANHLKLFDAEGYLFNPDMSDKNEWVFTR